MKQLIYSTLFLLGFSAYSQPYQSIFGQQSTYWIIEWGNLFGTTSDTIAVTKDTLVNGLLYKKVEMTSHSVGNNYPYGGLLREDLLQGKVWYRDLSYNPISDTSDLLVINYSLAKGDTFRMRTWGDPYSYYPTWYNIVDTVYEKNGQKNVVFYPNTNNYAGTDFHGKPVTFIEGEGSTISTLYLNAQAVSGTYLLCSYKDGIRTFLNNYYKTCDRTYTAIENNNIHKKLEICPNPATNKITIIWEGANILPKEAIISIFDTQGNQAYLEIPPFDLPQEIDISNFPIGLYFLQIKSNEQIQNKSFFKK